MARSQTADSDAYDVLGVSPNDSAEEIDAAFHRLIEGGGYRVGVPIRGQWLRAHQIKEAYATVGDPQKRRAYDESRATGSDRALWPGGGGRDDDSKLAALLRLPDEDQSRSEPSFKPKKKGRGRVKNELAAAPISAIGLVPDEIDPHVTAAAEHGVEEPPALEAEPDSNDLAGVELQHDPAPPDHMAPEVDHGSSRLWGGTVAAVLALGSLAYLGLMFDSPKAPDAPTLEASPATAPQSHPGARLIGQQPGPASPIEPGGLAGEIGTEGSPAQSAAEDLPAKTATAAASGPVAAPTLATAPAAETADPAGQAPGTEGEAATAASPASSPPPSDRAAVADAAQSPAAAPDVVQSPAQLIGGGPTRLDNPKGRLSGAVVVQFTVQADGRVSNCRAVESSGRAGLDALTCRLVEQRMRFKPALNAQGVPIASTAHAKYEWGRRRRHPSLLSAIFR